MNYKIKKKYNSQLLAKKLDRDLTQLKNKTLKVKKI